MKAPEKAVITTSCGKYIQDVPRITPGRGFADWQPELSALTWLLAFVRIRALGHAQLFPQ
jgi:hypothetical protein